MKIAIVDYGMGNLRSVAKAFEHVAPRATIQITAEPALIAAADRVVVPGQGAMHDCMREFLARGLKDVVFEAAASKPFLGICVGMQMLFEHSEEGDTPGLGLLKGCVKRFPDQRDARGLRLKVPHMAWNAVDAVKPHPVWQGFSPAERFYFVHSYYCAPDDERDVLARAQYGAPFTCAVARDNIVAIQFHPEKSAHAGLQLLANFVSWQA